MTTISKNEFYKKYENVEVVFYDYYKYKFYFKGEINEERNLYVWVGGNSDSIYKLSVTANEKVLLAKLNAFEGEIRDCENNLIEDFYEY